jgi:hypothetical protein
VPHAWGSASAGTTSQPVLGAAAMTTQLPETLSRRDHLESGRRAEHRLRRLGVVVLLAVLVLALLDVFGQRPVTTTASVRAARLQVYAPAHARSGLDYAARFRVDAYQDLKRPALILDSGWAEQYTVNGVAPQPISEGSDNGRLVFGLGHIPKGKHATLYLSLQVNPTNVGRHSQNVVLVDGSRVLARIHRTITIFP